MKKRFRNLMSAIRKVVLTRLNPGLVFEDGVFIDQGVRIRVSNGGQVRIGKDSSIERFTTIIVKRGVLVIGPGCFIGERSFISALERVEIGANALIAAGVTVRDMAHGVEISETAFKDQASTSSPIKINENVWLGVNCSVLLGVEIGRDSVIGAHAVVNRTVPPASLAVGVPARVIEKEC